MNELDELVSSISNWRKSRKSRGDKMPEAFKASALSLSEKLGMSVVSKRTGISSTQLKDYIKVCSQKNTKVDVTEVTLSNPKWSIEVTLGGGAIVRLPDVKSCSDLLLSLGLVGL